MTGGRDAHEEVVLVDADGRELGTLGKLEAHAPPGHLHRAVSLCLFDAEGRVLLQRRAEAKYHFRGRWSNSCCTHPRPHERPEVAIARRAGEELDLGITRSVACGTFVYRATDPRSGLVEWELDHVFAAAPVGRVEPHPDEVSEVRWVDALEARREAAESDGCTPWLAPVLELACATWFPNPNDRSRVA